MAIGLAAGVTFHALESRREETAALDMAAAGARHFEPVAMQVLLDSDASGQHAALARLLDRARFVGIRVFDATGALAYEAWETVPSRLVDAARSRSHARPRQGQSHREAVDIDAERLILVALPLTAGDGRLLGHIESVSRLDASTLQAQHDRARNAALTSGASVVVTVLLVYPMALSLLNRSAALSRRLLDSNLSLIRSLGNAVAKRDSGTDAHNYRVTLHSVLLAESMGLSKADISDLVAGAFLHDVGKIGIPDRILLKPGTLTEDEFEVMKTHVTLGLEIVSGNPWLHGAVATIRHHHERFDGSGYPDGLRGKAIPVAARLFAVVDVFDALTSERPYRKPMTLDEAAGAIARESGRHFDPDVVAAFVPIAAALHAAALGASDTDLRGRLREVLSRYFDGDVIPANDVDRRCIFITGKARR